MIDPGPRLRWFGDLWNHYWFRPVSPSNLGLCRILFFALFFRIYGFRDDTLWADVDRVFWMPIHLFELLGVQPLGHEATLWLSVLWKIAMLASMLGVFTRASTVVAAVLAAYFLGLPHSFGKMHHSDALGMLIFVSFALSRSGDAWSIDAWLRARRGAPPRVPSGDYHWPVQFVRVMMVLVFFAAGISKLRASGLEWVFSDNIRNTILWHYYNFDVPVDWGLWVAQARWLCVGLGAGSLLLELSAPLALFGRRLRMVLIPSLYAMQMGFWALMGVSFPPYLFCYYLFWIPWDRVLRGVLVRS